METEGVKSVDRRRAAENMLGNDFQARCAANLTGSQQGIGEHRPCVIPI